MDRRILSPFVPLAFVFLAALAVIPFAQNAVSGETRVDSPAATAWSFAVSGDSRNCGNVVMPAIATGVMHHGASLYWHLGDFRALYNFDEDIQHEPEHLARPLSISDYEQVAWDDFLQNQIAPFAHVPVFLGIGNHETVPPHTRELYLIQFADWLETPKLREQRLRDDPHAYWLTAYYHWIERGVDFINLDNATEDQFDDTQLAWVEKVLRAESANPEIPTIVVGMHEALPESIAKGHSMNQSPAGTESGRRVHQDLLKAQNEGHKRVYILAGHLHNFMGESSTRSTGARMAMSFPAGSSVRPALSVMRCPKIPRTRALQKRMCMASCSEASKQTSRLTSLFNTCANLIFRRRSSNASRRHLSTGVLRKIPLRIEAAHFKRKVSSCPLPHRIQRRNPR
jgi:calcineurin-like phosphoesterase family protein